MGSRFVPESIQKIAKEILDSGKYNLDNDKRYILKGLSEGKTVSKMATEMGLTRQFLNNRVRAMRNAGIPLPMWGVRVDLVATASENAKEEQADAKWAREVGDEFTEWARANKDRQDIPPKCRRILAGFAAGLTTRKVAAKLGKNVKWVNNGITYLKDSGEKVPEREKGGARLSFSKVEAQLPEVQPESRPEVHKPQEAPRKTMIIVTSDPDMLKTLMEDL